MRRERIKEARGVLWNRVKEQGGLRIPRGSDMCREWSEYVQAAGPGLLSNRTGLEPDVMSSVLGFDSESDMLDALIAEREGRAGAEDFVPAEPTAEDDPRLTPDERHTWSILEALFQAWEGGKTA